jgi:hypothetical protein
MLHLYNAIVTFAYMDLAAYFVALEALSYERPQRTLPKTRRLTELERTLVSKFRHFHAGAREPGACERPSNFLVQELGPDWAAAIR